MKHVICGYCLINKLIDSNKTFVVSQAKFMNTEAKFIVLALSCTLACPHTRHAFDVGDSKMTVWTDGWIMDGWVGGCIVFAQCLTLVAKDIIHLQN